MQFEAAIFDLDGTILDGSEEANITAARDVFNALLLPLTHLELASIVGRSSQQYVPEFLGTRGFFDAACHDEIIDRVRMMYGFVWDNVARLMPGADRVLRTLHARGILLALGTSNRRVVVDRFTRRFRFEGIFRHIVTGDDVKERKPDPEVFMTAARLLGVRRERIVVVEDTGAGVGLTAAKAAGLSCVVIPNKYSRHHDFSQADYVLHSLDELLPFFE